MICWTAIPAALLIMLAIATWTTESGNPLKNWCGILQSAIGGTLLLVTILLSA